MESLSAVRLGALLMVLCASGAQAQTRPEQWAGWLKQQVGSLPASRAINAEQARWQAENRDAAQPLYNPELNIGYENSADTTTTVGLSQTLDWSGKARARRDAGQVRDTLAQLRADKARADLLANSLSALVAHDAARGLAAAGAAPAPDASVSFLETFQSDPFADWGEVPASAPRAPSAIRKPINFA